MTDNLDSLILEHLRHIRSRVDEIAADMDDLKVRISSLDTSMLGVKREIVHGDEVDARLQVSIDRITQRLERIERRLDLS